jgi:hypothetical protein
MNPIGQQAPPEQEEEDTDYDPFAQWRPKGVSVDDNPEDEADGEQLDAFAEYRPREEEIQAVKAEKNKPKKPPTAWESAKDYAKQATKETLIGVGGTWGDLAELAGLNPKGGTPGQQAKNSAEFEILEKMQQPGYKPSFSDIYLLSGDDDIAPQPFSLPTSKDLEGVNEAIGGPGEPETPAGRYGKRQGRLYGSGLAFGQVNPIPAALAGGVGQTVEEAGGGPLLQAASEIATLLLTQGRGSGKTLVGSAKKEVADKINKLRQLGYAEEDITLAINSASKGRKAGFKASKGTKTEQAFENFAEHSDDMVNGILENGIQGYEKGAKHVHQMASDAYGEVVKEASKMGIKKLDPFFDSMDATMKEIRRSIGHNPEAKNFMIELTEHTLDIISNPTADNMIDFYKRLNGLGKWVGRNQKDRIISNVKESIKDTFKAEGKQGKELANKFEKVNEGIKKAYQAEDVMGIVEKATTQQGIDYKKLNKAFDKKDNVKLFEEVLGKKQADNLQMIAKTGKEVKDFDKAWKATHLLQGNIALDVARGAGVGYYIYKGDMEGLAAVLATKGLGTASKKIAEQFLTNPRFQNLLIRGMHAIKNESPKTFRSVNDAMQKYFDDEGIDVKI